MISYEFENSSLLAAVGIAWDISGGIALSVGLLLNDDTLRRRSGSYWGSSPPAIRGLVEQRLDARFGLLQLLTGFVIQLFAELGVGISPSLAVLLVIPIPALWSIYRYNYHYWVCVGSLRHVAPDASEAVWRKHFLDVPEMTWRSAVVQLGLTFKPPKS